MYLCPIFMFFFSLLPEKMAMIIAKMTLCYKKRPIRYFHSKVRIGNYVVKMEILLFPCLSAGF